MIQFKRFLVLIYLHIILSVFLTYLSLWFVFKIDFLKEDWLKVLVGISCLTGIYMVIGALWGLFSPQNEKLKLPLILYGGLLLGVLAYSIITQQWIFFINGAIPFTYFIRNIGSRDLWILVGYGLSCIIPVWALYLTFQLSYGIVHRKKKNSIK